MPSRSLPRPTDAELEILNVLWARGSATVREVHTELRTSRALGYTTVLKLLQIMAEKQLVERDESSRSHVYRPRHDAQRVKRDLVHDLMDRAFAGSASRLVQSALAGQTASAEELAEIRELLQKLEAERSGS